MLLKRTAVVMFLCAAALAQGQNVFYGSTGAGGAASSLYTINAATGATTLVGAIGFNGVGALAISPGGTLYGIAGNSGSGAPPHQLITINTSTGAGTAVGGVTGETINITDMAFRSDGALFIMAGNGAFYSVNTTTGAATLVGTGTGINSGGGLGFNSSGTLYVANGNNLSTVNTATGAQTFVTSLTFVIGDSLTGMKFHPTSGTLYATAFGLDSAGTSHLVTVNTGTGAMVDLGDDGVRLEALAISGTVTAPPPSTPVPSSLWLSGLGLFCLASWLLIRQSAFRAQRL